MCCMPRVPDAKGGKEERIFSDADKICVTYTSTPDTITAYPSTMEANTNQARYKDIMTPYSPINAMLTDICLPKTSHARPKLMPPIRLIIITSYPLNIHPHP